MTKTSTILHRQANPNMIPLQIMKTITSALMFEILSTKGCLEILQTLHKHKVMRRTDIERLNIPSNTMIPHNLPKLMKSGLITKARSRYEDSDKGYTLTNKGRYILSYVESFTKEVRKL